MSEWWIEIPSLIYNYMRIVYKYNMERETGITCFECGKYSGVDCPGRRPDEATRCVDCLNKFIHQMEVAQQAMEENKDALKKLADS